MCTHWDTKCWAQVRLHQSRCQGVYLKTDISCAKCAHQVTLALSSLWRTLSLEFCFDGHQCNFAIAQWNSAILRVHSGGNSATLQVHQSVPVVKQNFLRQGTIEQTFYPTCFRFNCSSGNEPLAGLLEQCQLLHANVQLAVAVDLWMQCAGQASNSMARCQVSCSRSP